MEQFAFAALVFVAALAGVALFFLPVVVAFATGHAHSRAIAGMMGPLVVAFALPALLGSFSGWVIFAWACILAWACITVPVSRP